jgi:hypothetical protein
MQQTGPLDSNNSEGWGLGLPETGAAQSPALVFHDLLTVTGSTPEIKKAEELRNAECGVGEN